MSNTDNIGPQVPKAILSAFTGLFVVIGHIALAFYIFTIAPLEDFSGVQIAAPVTLTYAITVVKWFVDNQGDIPRSPKVGISYVLLVTILFGSAFACLAYVLHRYSNGMNVQTANTLISAVESFFGALLIIIINDLFPDKNSSSSRSSDQTAATVPKKSDAEESDASPPAR
jgi:hypothetical protein